MAKNTTVWQSSSVLPGLISLTLLFPTQIWCFMLTVLHPEIRFLAVTLLVFSVVSDNDVLLSGPLPHHLSAQAAELIALTEACKLAKGKSVTIYTDPHYAFGVVHDFALSGNIVTSSHPQANTLLITLSFLICFQLSCFLLR